MAANEITVNVDRVSKSFGEFTAVRELSLTVRAGRVFGLLGPNGAGKTTSIRMIVNITAPDSGSISLFGRKINSELQNRIGYLPEERGLYRKMKIADQLRFFGETGSERDTGGSFVVFVVGFIMYLAILMYGVNLLASRGVRTNIPSIPFSHYIYFGLFFLLGYFIYATIYALVGSMVTTAQEGGQLAMPIILILLVSFYLFLPVSRSPDSAFSFWVSMVPFSAPVAMLVRIVTQTPPFWQIALSLLIGLSSVLLIMWAASRIYRVGMLMYGKRASIPEALRWARQA
jgi:ABC-type Fe3+/spermidine/putrescine transport system ATPase subunit